MQARRGRDENRNFLRRNAEAPAVTLGIAQLAKRKRSTAGLSKMSDPKLDDQIARQILRLELAAFFAPQPNQQGFIAAHDHPGIGATDEITPIQIEFLHAYTRY